MLLLYLFGESTIYLRSVSCLRTNIDITIILESMILYNHPNITTTDEIILTKSSLPSVYVLIKKDQIHIELLKLKKCCNV